MNVNKKIQSIRIEKPFINRLIAAVISLALVLGICVPDLRLFFPELNAAAAGYTSSTYSQTYDYFNHELTQAELTALVGQNGENGIAYGFEDQITGLLAASNNIILEKIVGQDNAYKIDAANTPFGLDLILEYNFSTPAEAANVIGTKQSDNTFTGGTPFIYYKLPSDIKLSQSYFGSGNDSKIMDDEYDRDIPAGYFYVSSSGYVIIKFTDDYIAHIRGKSQTFSGGVNFKGSVDRGDSQTGERTLTFNEQQLTIDFPDTALSAEKTGEIAKDGSGNVCVNWTITLTNPGGYINLNDYVLTDTLNGAAFALNGTNVTNLNVNGWDSTKYDILSDGSIKFKNTATGVQTSSNQPLYPETVTITYTQTGPAENTDLTNKATFTKTDNPMVENSNDNPIRIEDAYSITKYGAPDYQNGNGTSNKIEWVITAENKKTESLAGAVITDTISGTDAGACSFAGLTLYGIENGVKTDITAQSYYTVSGNTLTFNADFPYSKIEAYYTTNVAFASDATTGASVTAGNTARIEMPNKSSPTPDETTTSVTYYKELGVYKKVDEALNLDTNQVKWKIKIVSNATSVDANGYFHTDGNSKESLDGYIIEDSAFADIDISTITHNRGYSDNAWRGADKIQLTRVDGSTTQIMVTVLPDDNGTKPILRELELFYYTEVAEADRSNTITNEATVSKGDNSASHSVDYNYEENVQSNKQYKGFFESGEENPTVSTANSESVIGTADQNDRILKWESVLDKDLGFAGAVFTDVLQQGSWQAIDYNTSVNPNLEPAPKHYMTADQLSGIKIYVKEKTSDDWSANPLDNSNGQGYTVTPTDDGKSFTITFASDFDSKYRHVRIEYESTVETKSIPAGNKYYFGNKYNLNSEYPKDSNGWTFIRNDVGQVKLITLKFHKNWNDYNNLLQKRANTVTVDVYRALAVDGNAPTAENAWTFVESKNVNANNGYNSGDDTIGTEYPQWDDNGNMYCYKIVERAVDGYTAAYGEPVVLNEDSSTEHTLTVTNTISTPLKRAVDSRNHEITEATIANVPTTYIDIDGVSTKCYVFGWELILDSSLNTTYVVVDTLPQDSIFLYYNTPGFSEYSTYKAQFFNENGPWEYYANWNQTRIAEQNGNVLTMVVDDSNARGIRYYTAIPVTTLNARIKEGDNTLTNSFYIGEDSTHTYPATIELTGEIPPEVDYLTKSSRASENGGRMYYEFEFNPTAAKLSNSTMIDITDVLTLKSGSTKQWSDLTVSLDTDIVEVIQVTSSGEVTLNSSQYRVRIVDTGEEEKASFILSVPDSKHLKIKYTYDVSGYVSTDQIFFANEASFQTDNASGSDSVDSYQLNVSSSGGYVHTDTYPTIYKTDVNTAQIDSLSATFKVAKYTADGWLYASEVQNVLDSSNKVVARKFVYPASTDTNYANCKEASNATTFPSGAGNLVVSSELTHNFQLESHTLYKFVETVAPTNYSQPTPWTNGGTFENNKNFIFYYAYDGAPLSTPDDYANLEVHAVSQKGKLSIANGTDVTIKVNKSYSGITSSDNLTSGTSTAVMKLYWSHDNTGDDLHEFVPIDFGLSSNFATEKTVTYNFATGTSTTEQWADLPTEKDGYPVYYYVQEKSYTIGGTTYTRQTTGENVGKFMNGSTEGAFKPIYVNNGTNIDGDTIGVNNSKGIVVQKLWQDIRGNTVTPPLENNASMAIQFEVTAMTGGKYIKLKLLDSNNEPVTLNAGNQYQYVLPDTVTDINDVEYPLSSLTNIEITEKLTTAQATLLDGKYRDEPETTIIGGSVYQIINVENSAPDTEITVTKNWSDGASTHSADSVTVKLVRSTNADLTDAQITALASDTTAIVDINSQTVTREATLNSAVNWTHTWSDLPFKDTSSGDRYYYYVVETVGKTGYTASYSRVNEVGEQTVEITNTDSGKITVTKSWVFPDAMNAADKASYQQAVEVELVRRNLQTVNQDNWAWHSFDTPMKVTLNANNNWTAEFTGLDKDENWQYRVFETKIGNTTAGHWASSAAGYDITYDVVDGIKLNENSTPTLTVTNTLQTIQIGLIKQWSDSSTVDHTSDTVKVKLQRSTDSSDVPSLTLIDDSGGGNSQNVLTETINYEIKTSSWDKADIPSGYHDRTITSLAVYYNNTTPTSGDNFFIDDSTQNYIHEDATSTDGNVVTKTYTNKTDGVKVGCNTSSPESIDKMVITYSDGSTLTVNNIIHKTATIAIGDTETGTSIPNELRSKTVSNVQAYFRDDLSGFPNYQTHTNFYVSGLSDNDWTYSGKVATKWYNNNTTTDSSWVGIKTSHASEVEKMVINYTDGSTFTVNNSNYSSSSSQGNSNTYADYETVVRGKPPTLPIQSTLSTQSIYRAGKLNQVETVIAENDDISTIEAALTFLPKIRLLGNAPAAQWYEEVELSYDATTQTWTSSATLPKYDENGQPYYYWATETYVNDDLVAVSDYTPSYQFGDGSTGYIQSDGNGDKTITVRNTPTENPSEVELPEAGGTGTDIYCLTGAILLMLSAAGYVTVKRRRWFDE